MLANHVQSLTIVFFFVFRPSLLEAQVLPLGKGPTFHDQLGFICLHLGALSAPFDTIFPLFSWVFL